MRELARTLALGLLTLFAACGGPGSTPTDAGGQPPGEGAPAADVLTSPDSRTAVDAPGPDAPPDTSVNIETMPPPDAPAPAPLRIYLATGGDDKNDGLSTATSIKTLTRAQQIIAAAKPAVEVEVRIAPGTYYGQKVVWTYTMPTRRIRLMPLAGGKVRPVFDGCLSASPANPTTGCPGGTWFKLQHAKGQKTNLHFEYIQVQRYQTAISLNGDRNAAGTSNGANRIYGCYFYDIGTSYNTALSPSTAAVRLVNSDDNVIANTHFVKIVNHASCGLLHAIYAAHMSERNQILSNRFKTACGDPVRLRDFSNDNVIKNNKFIKAGASAAYSDWYCDHDVNSACTKKGPECPSWENQFRDNLLDGDWSCAPLSNFKLFQGDSTTGCTPPKVGAKRLYTSGNTKTAVPCTN